jgi:hypothetical protein
MVHKVEFGSSIMEDGKKKKKLSSRIWTVHWRVGLCVKKGRCLSRSQQCCTAWRTYVRVDVDVCQDLGSNCLGGQARPNNACTGPETNEKQRDLCEVAQLII